MVKFKKIDPTTRSLLTHYLRKSKIGLPQNEFLISQQSLHFYLCFFFLRFLINTIPVTPAIKSRPIPIDPQNNTVFV